MRSVPRLGLERDLGPLPAIPGNVPDLRRLPKGCRFHPRCSYFEPGLCDTELPPLESCGEGHFVRCLRWRKVAAHDRAPGGARIDAALRVRAAARCAPSRTSSFELAAGEVLGLVGESGSGKTTVGQAMLRLVDPTAGASSFAETTSPLSRTAELKPFRRQAQPIFQDPFGSLNPRMTVEEIIAEPLVVHGIGRNRQERRQRVLALLEQVGLPRDSLTRYPHQFSGGQRQRIVIARSLAAEPALIIADEPVSALDVSIQAQIINLLRELQQRLRLAMLFIAHDLAVVEYISDRVIVLYLGRIMEIGPARRLIGAPKHPYTEALISAVPEPDPDREGKSDRAARRFAEPDQPALRLRLPHALPLRDPRLRRKSAGAAPSGSRPRQGVHSRRYLVGHRRHGMTFDRLPRSSDEIMH